MCKLEVKVDPSFKNMLAEISPQIPPIARNPFDAVHSIRFTDDGERLTLVMPELISSPPPEHALAPDPQVECESRSNSWVLTARGTDAAARYRAAQSVFSRMRKRPEVPPFTIDDYQAPTNPRVACVIVLNENDKYVRQCLVPSLLGYESRKDLELIIVTNGTGQLDDLQENFGPIRLISSEWGCVGRAYQAGADATSADIIAFFHDDCMASHGDWVELVIDALEEDVGIVSQEVWPMNLGGICEHSIPPLPQARAYPLAITRKNLERVGGWDLKHFIGFEELDLSLAVFGEGLEVRQLETGFIHDSGLSTILKYGFNPPELREAFALGAIPRTFIRSMQKLVIRNLGRTKTGRRIRQDLFRHLLQRHPAAMKRVGTKDVSTVMEKLERLHAEEGSILDNWEEMVAFDRDLAGNARGAVPEK